MLSQLIQSFCDAVSGFVPGSLGDVFTQACTQIVSFFAGVGL
ncbi:MAG: hypothetical protein V3T70_01085 [Phycisphaerae bacterium]